MWILLSTCFNDEIGREREKERERERDQFVVPLICAIISWSLYVPWPGIKLATLVYGGGTVTDWTTLPGSCASYQLGGLTSLSLSFSIYKMGLCGMPHPHGAAERIQSGNKWRVLSTVFHAEWQLGKCGCGWSSEWSVLKKLNRNKAKNWWAAGCYVSFSIHLKNRFIQRAGCFSSLNVDSEIIDRRAPWVCVCVCVIIPTPALLETSHGVLDKRSVCGS